MLLLLLAALVYFYRTLPQNNTTTGHHEAAITLNRTPERLHFSQHARCRMACRDIDESEVKELLLSGRINERKSDLLVSDPCKKRYALEGHSRDQQSIRMVVASCGVQTTVITVIDLEKEWTCSCD